MPLPIAPDSSSFNNISEAAKAFTSNHKDNQYLVKVGTKWVILESTKLDRKTRNLVAKSFNEMKKETIEIESTRQGLPKGIDGDQSLRFTLAAAKINKKNYVKATDSKGTIGKVILAVRGLGNKSIKKKFEESVGLSSLKETRTKIRSEKKEEKDRIQTKKNELLNAEQELPKIAKQLIEEKGRYESSNNLKEKAQIYGNMNKLFNQADRTIKQLKVGADEKKSATLDQALAGLKEEIAPAAKEQLKAKFEHFNNQLADNPSNIRGYIVGQINGAHGDFSKMLSNSEIKAALKDANAQLIAELIEELTNNGEFALSFKL